MSRRTGFAVVAASSAAAAALGWKCRSRPRGRPLFALWYALVAPLAERGGLSDRRRNLLGRAQGVVLEVGAGTGQNFRHVPDGVHSIVAIEPDPTMARLARRHVGDARAVVRLVRAAVEHLPFADASFDTVVVTLVLCTVDDPSAALHELRRVLRPSGRMLLLEHVRSDDEELAHWQDRLERPWARLNGGCRPNRATVAAVVDSGFVVTEAARYGSAALPLVEAVATAIPDVSTCHPTG